MALFDLQAAGELIVDEALRPSQWPELVAVTQVDVSLTLSIHEHRAHLVLVRLLGSDVEL